MKRFLPGQFLEVGDVVIRQTTPGVYDARLVTEDNDSRGDLEGYGHTRAEAADNLAMRTYGRQALSLARKVGGR